MRGSPVEFDWESLRERRSPVIVEYLESVFDTEISEERFAAEMSILSRKRPHGFKNRPSKTRSPNHCRRWYRSLKERYGFFTGNRGESK